MRWRVGQGGAAIGALALAVWLCGCATAAHGPRPDLGASFRDGELHAPVDATPEEIVAAARRTLGEMRITLLDAEATDVDGQAVGLTVSGAKVVVTAVRETAGPSQMSIRVGALGDEGLSRMIYDRMRAVM